MGDTNPGNAVVSRGENVVLSPDPSQLTRELIAREMGALRELLHAEIAGETSTVRARLNAMDEAVKIFTEGLTRVPTETQRAVTALREIVDEKFSAEQARIGGRASTVEARFDGMDRALALLQTIDDRLPALMDAKVTTLTALHDERFSGVEKQFLERDTRTAQSKAAGDDALKAALQAQKESAGDQLKALQASIDKSEAATTKLLEALGETLKTATASQNEKLETLTRGLEARIVEQGSRLDRMESGGAGRALAVVDQRATAGELRAWMLSAVTIIVAVITVLSFALTHR